MPDATLDQIRYSAAEWATRLKSGLTPDQEEQFADWLGADPRHEEALTEHQQVWDNLGALQPAMVSAEPNADLFAPSASTRRGRSWNTQFFYPVLAAAAVIALAFVALNRTPARSRPTLEATMPAQIVSRTLPDGSAVELNRGAEIAVHFTDTERHVDLLIGEANFRVTKDVTKPFIVRVGGTSVRAVGTAFNVRYDATAIEVVVTEGRVEVTPPSRTALPILEAGQHTLVPLRDPSASAVAKLEPAQIETRLAWQPKLLTFDDAPLSQIVAEFNRRNPVQLTIDDATLQSLPLNATFRSDNMQAFVRLIEENFGIRAEAVSESEIVLKKR